ncbi:MAG TPA: hypothetical protein VN277_06265 [Acidiferrobacterales bacterium]|nr:hypothetical protein [Acidiferrobacterales bacterium]
MIGRTEHQGERFVIVCLPDGTRIHVPEAIASQSALPAVSRAEAVQLLASLLYEVQQAQARQPANAEAGYEQDQR